MRRAMRGLVRSVSSLRLENSYPGAAMNPFLMRNFTIGVLLAFLSGHALAQSTDNSRGVRIIDGP